MSELADTIYQLGDFLTKLCANVIFANPCILNDIVQKRGHEALRVHVHAGQNAGNRKRMCHIGFATASGLAVVCLL